MGTQVLTLTCNGRTQGGILEPIRCRDEVINIMIYFHGTHFSGQSAQMSSTIALSFARISV